VFVPLNSGLSFPLHNMRASSLSTARPAEVCSVVSSPIRRHVRSRLHRYLQRHIEEIPRHSTTRNHVRPGRRLRLDSSNVSSRISGGYSRPNGQCPRLAGLDTRVAGETSLGPTVAEISLLSIERPVLSLLLSFGSPVVFPVACAQIRERDGYTRR
jgi:hypothetical protein